MKPEIRMTKQIRVEGGIYAASSCEVKTGWNFIELPSGRILKRHKMPRSARMRH